MVPVELFPAHLEKLELQPLLKHLPYFDQQLRGHYYCEPHWLQHDRQKLKEKKMDSNHLNRKRL